MQQIEIQAIENLEIDKAEQANLEIKKLKEKEILLQNFLVIQKNQREFTELQHDHQNQIEEFNDKWNEVMEELQCYSQQIMQAQRKDQEQRQQELIDDLQSEVPSNFKYTSQILNEQFKLKKLLQQKQYQQAKEIKRNLDEKKRKLEEEQTQNLNKKKQKKLQKLVDLQQKELEGLQNKLQKSIEQKIQQREENFQQLLQKLKNTENEMLLKHNRKLSKAFARNQKLFQKYQICKNKKSEQIRRTFKPPKSSYGKTQNSSFMKSDMIKENMQFRQTQQQNIDKNTQISNFNQTEKIQEKKFDLQALKQRLGMLSNFNDQEDIESSSNESSSDYSSDEDEDTQQQKQIYIRQKISIIQQFFLKNLQNDHLIHNPQDLFNILKLIDLILYYYLQFLNLINQNRSILYLLILNFQFLNHFQMQILQSQHLLQYL